MDWTVEELLERAQGLISEYGQAGGSRRVRWEPNQRLVRYYTTLGLVDKPAGRRGQVVHYGPRHLLQLLAIKQMQTEGMTLQQIQARMLGLPDSMLAELAGIPSERLGLPRVEPPAPPERFWERRAAPYDTVNEKSLRALELPGATLLLEHRDLPADELRAALQPLLELLRRYDKK